MDLEEYSEYWDTIEYDDVLDELPESSFNEVYNFCLKLSLEEVFPYIWKLLVINFIFLIFTRTKPVPLRFCHITSIVCGIVVQYCLLRSSPIYINIFILYSFISLHLFQSFNCSRWPYYFSISCILYLTMSEFTFPLPDVWAEMRGLHMLVAMKVISISFDLEKKLIDSPPNSLEFCGYIYCPSNCLFGPWVSFNAYKSVFHYHAPLFNFVWIRRIIFAIVLSITFLSISNCWTSLLILQNWKWITIYQEALSFRTSHYFISYLSEATMLIGGFNSDTSKKKKDATWSYSITYPLSIELPRSLVQVVIYWNVPMHLWLKTYVFQVCKPIGSFYSILITYLVSAFLHGFNKKLAAVLLSLGFYTYIEFKLRHKLSVIFDACIGANPCKKCNHQYKTHCYVYIVNFLFGCVSIFHLAYLGCLLDVPSMEGKNDNGTFKKWFDLDFASHWLTGLFFLLYKLC